MDESAAEARQEATVFRVQDKTGRGPFRPGVTDQWRDPDGTDYPPIQAEFGLDWQQEIPANWHCGCALRDVAAVKRWFSPWECHRLHILGYNLVTMRARVLRESTHQMLIMRALPLRFQAVVQPWPHCEPAMLSPWKFYATACAAKGGA